MGLGEAQTWGDSMEFDPGDIWCRNDQPGAGSKAGSAGAELDSCGGEERKRDKNSPSLLWEQQSWKL